MFYSVITVFRVLYFAFVLCSKISTFHGEFLISGLTNSGFSLTRVYFGFLWRSWSKSLACWFQQKCLNVTFKRLQTQSSVHVSGPAQRRLFSVPVWPGLFAPHDSVFPADSRHAAAWDTPKGLGRLSPGHSRKSDPGVLLDLISSLRHH